MGSVRCALPIYRFIRLCGDSFARPALQTAIGTILFLRCCRIPLRPVDAGKKEMNGRLVRALLFCSEKVRQSITLLSRLDERSRAIDAGLHELRTTLHGFVQMCECLTQLAVRLQYRVAQLPVGGTVVRIVLKTGLELSARRVPFADRPER